MNSKDGSLINKVASLLVDKDLVKPYEAIDVTFANSRLNEIEQNIPLKSKNKTDPSIAPTITTSISNYGFCVPSITEERDMNNEPFIVASRGRNPENPSDRTTGSPTEQRLEPNTKGLCNTLTTVQKDNYVAEQKQSNLRIRKLTPKECFRLMGFDDEDFYKAEAVNSNTQLYKQAGNSIVMNVLEALFINLRPYLEGGDENV